MAEFDEPFAISGKRLLGITGLNFDTHGLGLGKRPDELPRPSPPPSSDWVTAEEGSIIMDIDTRYFIQITRRKGLKREPYTTVRNQRRSFRFLRKEVEALKAERDLKSRNGVVKKGRPSG